LVNTDDLLLLDDATELAEDLTFWNGFDPDIVYGLSGSKNTGDNPSSADCISVHFDISCLMAC
jgi:hypothetical protein